MTRVSILLVGDSYSDQNLYYKTHFLAGDTFVYLETGGRGLLVTGAMERGRAEKESIVEAVRTFEDYGYRDLLRELNDHQAAFGVTLARILAEEKLDAVVTGATFPALYADQLRAAGIAVELNTRLLREERRQKSTVEIAAIEEAQRATERAAALAIDLLRRSTVHEGLLHHEGAPLTAERLRTEIDVSLITHGMDTSLSPIVACGPGAADPHWEGAGPIGAGQALVLDIFPRGRRSRYFADLTRTVVKGEPGEQLRFMYVAVLRAQEAGLREIRAGANGRDVHAAVEAVFEDAGYGQDGPGARYIHGTGHGVGLAIHEAPSLGFLDVELVENDVVTVEPGLYDPAIGAVRIEDLVVVTREGCRNLTQFPKSLEL